MTSKSIILVLTIITHVSFAQIRLPKTSNGDLNNAIENRVNKKKEKKEPNAASQTAETKTDSKSAAEAEAEFDKLPSNQPSKVDDKDKLDLALYNKLLVDWEKDPKNKIPVASKSAIHKKYNTKIVWSNEPISFDQPNEAKFKNTFKITEQIYGRMFFDKGIEGYPLYNQMRSELHRNHNTDPNNMNTTFARLCVKYYLDGAKEPWYTGLEYVYTSNDPGNNTGQLFVLPTGEDFYEVTEAPQIYNSLMLNVQKINSLPTGEHFIRVEVWGGDETYLGSYSHSTVAPIATGEFKIIKNSNEMASDPSKYIKKRLFNEIETGMKNPALEAQMLAAFKPYAKKMGFKGEAVKIKIRDKEWIPSRNEYTGVLVGRSLYTAIVLKEGPDNCTMYGVTFYEDYNGGGKYGSVYALIDDGLSYCECNK